MAHCKVVEGTRDGTRERSGTSCTLIILLYYIIIDYTRQSSMNDSLHALLLQGARFAKTRQTVKNINLYNSSSQTARESTSASHCGGSLVAHPQPGDHT